MNYLSPDFTQGVTRYRRLSVGLGYSIFIASIVSTGKIKGLYRFDVNGKKRCSVDDLVNCINDEGKVKKATTSKKR